MLTRKLKLKHVRVQARLYQRELAEQAGVSRVTVWKAENGESINLETAYKLLDAINAIRATRGQDVLDLESLDWQIRGE